MYHYLVPLFICICVYLLFIYLFIESRGLVSDLMVLMLFVLQCTDYEYNFLTLTHLITTITSWETEFDNKNPDLFQFQGNFINLLC